MFADISFDDSLRKYIDHSILVKYSNFDRAHDYAHVCRVIKNSLELCSSLELCDNLNIAMVYTIAAYHDIGLLNGRDNHEIVSAFYLTNDAKLKKWFTSAEIRIMSEAVEDHRASNAKEPRSIYGKIISDADRDIDYEMLLKRAIQYGLNNHPELNKKQHLDRVFSHLNTKYGKNGYVVFWIDHDYNEIKLRDIQEKISRKRLLKSDFASMYSREMKEMKCKDCDTTRLLNNVFIRLINRLKKNTFKNSSPKITKEDVYV
jgi:uncharacterized protein